MNLVKLGFIVVFVFGTSFGPFIAMVSWLINAILNLFFIFFLCELHFLDKVTQSTDYNKENQVHIKTIIFILFRVSYHKCYQDFSLSSEVCAMPTGHQTSGLCIMLWTRLLLLWVS